MKLLDTIAAWLDLTAAELRTGLSLIEAAEIDKANLELLAVTGTQEAANEVRAMALDLAKLGIRREDIEPMARYWFLRPQHSNERNEK